MQPKSDVTVSRWQHGEVSQADDTVAEEVAVALVYNGISHVVMMCTPDNLSDFALGFSLTEGIIQSPSELYEIDETEHPDGIGLQLTISAQRQAELKQKRRNLTGRTGCGLCGAESLQQAVRPATEVSRQAAISDEAVQQAVHQLEQHQPLQAATGACHGAAWCSAEGEILLVREDVGRHNALDKLIGALASSGTDRSRGFALVSSRASYEMVQKVTSAGIGTLVAVSAPTGLALRLARDANLQLIGFARPQRHVSYSPGHSTGDTDCGEHAK
ncbi:formate dehydrogenase accessory sulfurtransferase FdhD [Marinobacterium jannaschii]|uniref:formate dehydrogenase accessory sulfurtransferase FdhD n=1 Tax=Marinobacterium jannaschii TaxID=64970 RepID=UPI001B8080FD|nr:formate dehydrogenase accessory sulfurtransferase FdhD [Marinobacterium jannaschii]